MTENLYWAGLLGAIWACFTRQEWYVHMLGSIAMESNYGLLFRILRK